MPKIIIFSDQYLPTQPYLEIPLYNELKHRDIQVLYVLQKNDIRLTDQKLYSEFKKLNIATIKGSKDVVSLLNKGDLFISRFVYKLFGGKISDAVRSAKHNILHLDPSGIDIRVRSGSAQYLTAKSENLKNAVLKKYPRHYKGVFTTGTLHYDAVATTNVDRDEFMKSYGLNPNKKFALLVPANPGEGWMPGIQDDYKQIVRTIQKRCPDYELAIKCHPYDYTAELPAQPGIIHKSQHYGGNPCWKVIAPGTTVIKAEDGFGAINACDVLVNIRSSLAMEVALFRKPLINVNRAKYITNWPFDKNIMIDIKLNELESTLNNNNYSTPDEKKCLNYIKEYCYSDDGKSFVRVTDIALKILNGKI